MALKAIIGKAAALLSCLVLGGCAGPDAITHLTPDLSKYGTIEIIHARFPCFSPDFHLYGYRFRVATKKPHGATGEHHQTDEAKQKAKHGPDQQEDESEKMAIPSTIKITRH